MNVPPLAWRLNLDISVFSLGLDATPKMVVRAPLFQSRILEEKGNAKVTFRQHLT